MALVLNPIAHNNKRFPDQTRSFIKAFEELGESVVIGETTDLGEEFVRWKQEELDLLVISGGDGTMQRVLGELLRVWGEDTLPRMLLIHGGTGGLVPTSTGNPDPTDAISLLKHSLQNQSPLLAQHLQTLRVGDRATFSCGTGIFRRLFSEYVTYRGRVDWSRVILAARFAASWLVQGGLARHAFAPCPVQVRIGDDVYPSGHFIGIYASALDSIWGLGAFGELPRPPEGFRVIALQAISKRSMLKGIPPLVRGDKGNLPPELLLQGTSLLELRSDNDLIIYEAEGEFYSEKGPLRIKAGTPLTVIRLK